MYSSFSSFPEYRIDYPFLYSFAASVLQKLNQCNLDEFGDPNDMQNDVEMLKGILNHLPSIIKTHDLLINKTTTHDDVDDDNDDADDDDDANDDDDADADAAATADADDADADAVAAADDDDPDDGDDDADAADDEDQHRHPHHDDFGSSIIFDIQKSVFGLHDLLNEQLHPSFESSWKDLVAPLTKFRDHKHPESSRKEENLLSSLSVQLPEIESQDVKVNNLPVHLVPCLAYCALYPKGYRVVRETLVNQWMAEGFLELQTPSSSSGSSDLELEDVGNRYFMELLSMGVFVKPLFGFGGNSANQQAVTVYSCEIHPRIHKLACQMARNEISVIQSDKEQFYYEYHLYRHINERPRRCNMYIALHRNLEEYEWRRKYDELQTGIRTCLFFVPKIRERVLERIISDLSELQILDLAEIQSEKLLASLSKTGKLRYLAFSRNTHLKRLDKINWSSLQTLAVDGCVELEKVNLEHTSHMRHLYYTSKEATLEVHTSTLRILQLSYCSELRSFSLSNSANFTCLRRLCIFECPRLISLPDSNDLLAHVEELVFHNCARLDLNCGRSMDSLPSLHYMELIGLPKLTELPAGVQSARALHYLMIGDCKILRSTDHVLQHFDALQKLCVYDCPTLSIAPNAFQSLTALQSLDVRKSPNIKITSTKDAGKHKAPFISHIPEVFLDGQQLLDQSATAPAGPQTDFLTPTNFPHFILSFEIFEHINSSQGMLFEKYKLKKLPSRWLVLALALKAIVNLRILQQRKLYCCLFPSDYEFERDTLFQLWLVRGFLPEHWEHHLSNEHWDHLTNKCFDRLLKEKCIYKSRVDMLTGITKYKNNVDKVLSLSNRFKFKDRYISMKDEDTRVDGSTSWHHVSVASKNIDKKVFHTLEELDKLRSVLFLRDYGSSLKQIPPTFFKAHQYMQALDLSGSHISELPSSIGKMTDLRFLDLSFTLIERIPESIHLLKELQTLKLRGCKHLHTLPKGMKELVNLYYLEFDVLGQLTSMPKGLGSLTKLRTLPAFIVSKEDGCRLSELKGMNDLCGSLCISGLECASLGIDAIEAKMEEKTRLTRLHLKWNGSKCYDFKIKLVASSALQFLRPHSSLSELQISNHPGLDLPHWIAHSENLVSITFLNCDIDDLDLGWKPNLRHLNIYDMNKPTEISVRFPKLETITIDGMSSLEKFWVNQVDKYQHLSQVSIKNCPKLTGLPFLPFLGSSKYLEISHCESFKSLPQGNASTSPETLIIDNCPLLKERCSKDGVFGDDWNKIKHVKNIWIDMKRIRSSQDDTEDKSESSHVESQSPNDKSG